MINDEIVAIVGKLLDFECISTEQHKILLIILLIQLKNMKLLEVF